MFLNYLFKLLQVAPSTAVRRQNFLPLFWYSKQFRNILKHLKKITFFKSVSKSFCKLRRRQLSDSKMLSRCSDPPKLHFWGQSCSARVEALKKEKHFASPSNRWFSQAGYKIQHRKKLRQIGSHCVKQQGSSLQTFQSAHAGKYSELANVEHQPQI